MKALNVNAMNQLQVRLVQGVIENDPVYASNLRSLHKRVSDGKVSVALAGRIARSLIEKAVVRAARQGKL